MAVNIMIQGTMSNAGKSLVAAGLCRVFYQDGYSVAPFKSQNMALNSYITDEGLEMGRAQVVQAEACEKKPSVLMNPILLKPTTNVGSQVIVNGKVVKNMSAADYFSYKKELIPHILDAYDKLAQENDIIVIEGAGSPAEINLKADDIVNMGMAEMVDAPVLLVGDIDRGGVFAQLAGTIMLLEEGEKERIKGMIINKFRGDVTILEPGLRMIEDICKKPVLGVIPYAELNIDDEDSLTERFSHAHAQAKIVRAESTGAAVAAGTDGHDGVGADTSTDAAVAADTDGHDVVGADRSTGVVAGARIDGYDVVGTGTSTGAAATAGTDGHDGVGAGRSTDATINISIVRLPRISNFSDFSIFDAIDGVSVTYAERPDDLKDADIVILPGTKNTISDLDWLRRTGIANAVIAAARAGRLILGICGGYQMLGESITDEDGAESPSGARTAAGLGLLPTTTHFSSKKVTTQVSGWTSEISGPFARLSNVGISGYEIHMGVSVLTEDAKANGCSTFSLVMPAGAYASDPTQAAAHASAKSQGSVAYTTAAHASAKSQDAVESIHTSAPDDGAAHASDPTQAAAHASAESQDAVEPTCARSTTATVTYASDPTQSAITPADTASASRTTAAHADGLVRDNVIGTYIHGVFDSADFTAALLSAAAQKKGLDPATLAVPDMKSYKESQYDKLADIIRSSLDIKAIYRIMGLA